jgi:hypothetical protein
MMQRFRQRAMHFGVPGLPEAWDPLGWWELMQHHRAPTRLMDWTTSPFVAIWFALDGHEDGEGDMALWASASSLTCPSTKPVLPVPDTMSSAVKAGSTGPESGGHRSGRLA